MFVKRLFSVTQLALAGALALVADTTFALGTPAGTSIQNTAQVNYTVGGTSLAVSSNPTSLTVAEILNVIAKGYDPLVEAGQP